MSRIVEVGFEAGGERCAGWLHLPEGEPPHPGIVMLHSTAGVRQLRCYAERGRAFAEAGVATLQFDCRGFGASEGEPRQLFDVRRQAEDLDAALAFARSRSELDGERLALWGGSASCAQVLDRAAGDDGIGAVVCLTPFVPGRATQGSAGTPIVRLGATAFADRLRMALGREPRGVRVGGEPGEAAILVREDAAARERAMLPPEARIDPSGQRAELDGGVVWENRVVLRPRLRTPNPLRVAPRVSAPLLVVAGEEDVLCPPGPAAELARRAPQGDSRFSPAATSISTTGPTSRPRPSSWPSICRRRLPPMPSIYRPTFEEGERPEGFRSRRARIGYELGAELIGASLWEMPPGEAAYPYHYHYSDEELVIVVSGRPSLRTREGIRELEEGEAVRFELGEEGAHQLINNTDETVTFLAISSSGRPDVIVYPDSDKVGVRLPRGGDLRAFFHRDDSVSYWAGEEPPAADQPE